MDTTDHATGWGRATYPKVLGTRDATRDGHLDIWAADTLGKQWLYSCDPSGVRWAPGADDDGWNTFLAIG